MKELLINPNFSATISLETEEIGKIRGLQFSGFVTKASQKEKLLYIKTFPDALAMNPTLWTLHVDEIKFTDNRLGFGKKLIFKREKDGVKLTPVDC